MPVVNGRWQAPRKPVKKAQNAPLVAVYLAVDLIERELVAQGGDWDKVLSSLRTIREEPSHKRNDGLNYQQMTQFIKAKRDEWGAW